MADPTPETPVKSPSVGRGYVLALVVGLVVWGPAAVWLHPDGAQLFLRAMVAGFYAVVLGVLGSIGYGVMQVVLAVVTWPAWHRESIAAERLSRGECPACGYDLRGSPDRCPECGSVRRIQAGL